MRKRRIAILCVIGLICLLTPFVWNKIRQAKQPSFREQAYEMMDRVEIAAQEVLGEDFKKQSVTEVIPYSTYADKDGNEAIVYYISWTTYYESDPAEVTGFHEDAVSAILEFQTVTDSRSCKVNDWDGMLYKTEKRHYLCWTVAPEFTMTLEYEPEAVTEEDIFKMAESVSWPEKD